MEVTTIHGSKKDLELLEKEKFDLVILDLVMPAFYVD
jgi:DNA-binding response OmpR family regulator